MSCKYCEYPDGPTLSTCGKRDGNGDGSIISYNAEDNTFDLYTLDSFDLDTEIHKVEGVKYCPFCGEKLKAPDKERVKMIRNWDRDWERRKKESAKSEAKREKERREWLEQEYKNNPYDPTKPRIKNEDFREAVRHLAKYMNIKEFYWDDELRKLTGWHGGYIDMTDGSIGPCYETNGVMESYHDSGKTYTVKELCEGFKDE